MNEMLYGNTGKRDEGLNISMEQSVYQKLQSRAYVPKLKQMLNDRLQDGDKSFVFIGEIADKAGNFSIYGYNAKLRNDARGGDYGHYIAVPADSKKAVFDVNAVKFLTEEGFVEYVNTETLNESERFNINCTQIEINNEAKKRIINNIMETFMKVRKRKSVSFCFDDFSAEEFTSKSVFVLSDLMKYIPYAMRKNISFISRVASKERLPDFINLVAYPEQSDFKPHDSICLSDNTPATNGMFTAYAEKVVAMSDNEREEYFEKICSEIEIPAVNAGVDIKSDIYLLDAVTKVLWTQGDAEQAVKEIFSSVDDVLKIYPEYAKIAGDRINSNSMEVFEYISNQVKSTSVAEQLKAVYDNVSNVFKLCSVEFAESRKQIFSSRVIDFVKFAQNDSEIIKILDVALSTDRAIIDIPALTQIVSERMPNKKIVREIHTFYINLKQRNLIDAKTLDNIYINSIDKLITDTTQRCQESKDKLSALERIYKDLRTVASGGDITLANQVFSSYKTKFSGDANTEAFNKAKQIILSAEATLRDIRHTILDNENIIKNLDQIEFKGNESVKKRTAEVYAEVSVNFIEGVIVSNVITGNDFKKIIAEIAPAVKSLHAKGICDVQPMRGWGNEVLYLDGLYRLVTCFETFYSDFNNSQTLSQVILAAENTVNYINNGERKIRSLFDKYGTKMLMNWFNNNQKQVSTGSFKKAVKELQKENNIRDFSFSENAFDKYIKSEAARGNNVDSSKTKIIIAVAAAAVVILIVGAIALFGGRDNDVDVNADVSTNVATNTDADMVQSYYFENQDKAIVLEYLSQFSADGFSGAVCTTAIIERTDSQNLCKVIVTTAAGGLNLSLGVSTDVIYDSSSEVLSLTQVQSGKEYIVVLQQKDDNSETYLKRIFPMPEDLANHNYNTESDGYRYLFGEKASTIDSGILDVYTKIVKCIGCKKGFVELP